MWDHIFDWIARGNIMLLVIGAAVAALVLMLLRLALSDRSERRRTASAEPPKSAEVPPPQPARPPTPAPAPAQVSPAPPRQRTEGVGSAREPSFESMRAPAPVAAPAAGAPVADEMPQDHSVVTVHFGTDRNDTAATNPRVRFGSSRAKPVPGLSPVSYGTCTVSIPKIHQIGELEAPGMFSSWQPGKHVQLLGIDPQTGAVFHDTLRARIAASTGQAFIFVHGFSVAFEDAARRTAQMAFDMKFDGAPIFFSWPTSVIGLTNIDITAYSVAENNSRWATHHFATFLTDVVRKSGAQTVHLIAHSMGNRVVTDALMELFYVLTPAERKVLKEVILTAPDIDADVFIEQIAPRITKMDARVTLYASTKDSALGTSSRVHGYPRVGDMAALSLIPGGVEVIDASEVDTDSFGHSYYGNAESVITDICYLLTSNAAAPKRGTTLVAMKNAIGEIYWRVRKETKLVDLWSALTAKS